MKNTPNYAGKKFGRLTVVEYLLIKGDGRAKMKCLCECGNTKVARASHVISGQTQSCGCLRKESDPRKGHKTHGMHNSPVYRNWQSMLHRCLNPKNIGYEHYKNFAPCEFLRASPANLEFIVGAKPGSSLTIDRIKNADGYHCGQCAECISKGWNLNVRWATKAEQNRNMSRNRIVVIGGVSKLLVDWSRELGVNRCTLSQRLKKGYYGQQPEPAKN